jgi:hypothetical protein
MPDNKPRNNKRKRAQISSALVGAISLAGVIAFLLAHPAARRAEQFDRTASKTARVIKTPAPVAGSAILGRNDLLSVARMAASTFAATGKLDGHDSVLKRRFALRIAFGCYEDGNTGGQTSLTFNPDYRSATLSARPTNWTSLPLIESFPWKAEIEGVEGFWLPRAWTQSESCPPQANYTQPLFPTPPTSQSVGLAQLFMAGGARRARHSEKPYQFLRKLPPEDPGIRSHHYYLLLEGIIAGFPDGRDLHCWMEGADHQPLCLFAVEFDNIAFEDGVTGEVLASWRG